MMADSGTYDQATITRRQKIAEQMLADDSKVQPIRHWAQGLAQLGNVGADVFTLNRLDKQAATARDTDRQALLSILGGDTGSPPAPARPSPSAAPLAPPSPSIIDAGGPAKPDAQGVYGADAVMAPSGAQASTDTSLPRGIRNNNPLNIESGPFTQGQPGFAGSDGRFARFDQPQQGVDAAGKLLDTYQGKYGLNTVRGIINRWAPSSENDTRGYVASVAGRLGVDPDQPLSPEHRQPLIEAMGQFENGRPIGGKPAVASAMSPMAFNGEPSQGPTPTPTAAPPAAPPAPAAPLAGQNAPQGIPDQQKRAIASAMMATPGSPVQQLGIQLAAQSLKPHDYTHQTLPDGTILRLDPTGKAPPQVIYQAPVKPELKDTGTDPLTGQKSFSEYNPQTHTLTPMGGGGPAAADQSFNAIAAAKERGASPEELYQQVPISLRNGVKAMIEGKSVPTNLSARGAARDATLKYAHAIDENFDEQLIPQRKTFATSMGSQQINSFGGQVTKSGTIVKHIGGASDALNTLIESGALNETLPILNKPQIALKAQSGDKKFNDALGRYETDVEGAAGELTQLLTGGVGAEHTKQQWRDRFDIRTQPISKVKTALAEATQLMMGRLSNVAQAKERAFGTPTDPLSLLGKDEQAIMSRLKAGTYQGEAKTEPTAAVAQTATNPQTGERVQLNPKTGQWEPLK